MASITPDIDIARQHCCTAAGILCQRNMRKHLFFFTQSLSTDCHPLINSPEMHANICTTTSRLIRWREANTFLVGARNASNHGSCCLLGGTDCLGRQSLAVDQVLQQICLVGLQHCHTLQGPTSLARRCVYPTHNVSAMA